MAEIHVQAKKRNNASPAWIWIAIVLLIAAAVIYFVTRNKETNEGSATSPSSHIEWVKAMRTRQKA